MIIFINSKGSTTLSINLFTLGFPSKITPDTFILLRITGEYSINLQNIQKRVVFCVLINISPSNIFSKDAITRMMSPKLPGLLWPL